jgi:hypothetical protein
MIKTIRELLKTTDTVYIGITGYARSGKDTVATILWDSLQKELNDTYVLKHSLAASLKNTLRFMTQDNNYVWDDNKGCNSREFPGHTYREVMISFGDWARSLNEDIFVQLLMKGVKEHIPIGHRSVVIIPDVRRLNEHQKMHLMIRVKAEGCGPGADHPTEGELDSVGVDYEIDNTRDPSAPGMDRLTRSVKAIL